MPTVFIGNAALPENSIIMRVSISINADKRAGRPAIRANEEVYFFNINFYSGCNNKFWSDVFIPNQLLNGQNFT